MVQERVGSSLSLFWLVRLLGGLKRHLSASHSQRVMAWRQTGRLVLLHRNSRVLQQSFRLAISKSQRLSRLLSGRFLFGALLDLVGVVAELLQRVDPRADALGIGVSSEMDRCWHSLRRRRTARLWPDVLLLWSLGSTGLFLEVQIVLIRFYHSRLDELLILRVTQRNERDVVVLLALSVGRRGWLWTPVLETQLKVLVDSVLLHRGAHRAQSGIRCFSGFRFLFLGSRFARVGSLAGVGRLSTAYREPRVRLGQLLHPLVGQRLCSLLGILLVKQFFLKLSDSSLQLLNLGFLLLFLLPRQLLMRAQPGIQVPNFLAHPANMGLLLSLLVSQVPNLLNLGLVLHSQVLNLGIDALELILGPHLLLLNLLFERK